MLSRSISILVYKLSVVNHWQFCDLKLLHVIMASVTYSYRHKYSTFKTISCIPTKRSYNCKYCYCWVHIVLHQISVKSLEIYSLFWVKKYVLIFENIVNRKVQRFWMYKLMSKKKKKNYILLEMFVRYSPW